MFFIYHTAQYADEKAGIQSIGGETGAAHKPALCHWLNIIICIISTGWASSHITADLGVWGEFYHLICVKNS